MADVDVIVRDSVTGLFGFRVELGRDRAGSRLQARRGGFVTERAALAEYRRLCRQRDARRPRLRLSDTVQTLCEDWLAGRVQQLQPNTLSVNEVTALVVPHGTAKDVLADGAEQQWGAVAAAAMGADDDEVGVLGGGEDDVAGSR